VQLPAIDAVRAHFPALASDCVFMDNAGGSQVPAGVADAIRDYMLTSYVQLGADYDLSKRATQTVDGAHAFMNTFMGGDGIGKTILGPSTSALCRMLADCYEDILRPGDEIVVATSGHEANVAPWLRLATRGATVRFWEPNPVTGLTEASALEPLLSERTRLVAVAHVSNVLGAVEDLAPSIAMAHQAGARVLVDGVAYAAHRAIDVAALGADFYVFSCYKVFGPHMAALFGKHEALAELTGPNHAFVPRDSIPAKFELGGVLHEGCAGLLALRPYLGFLAGRPGFDRSTVVGAFDAIVALEDPLTKQVLDYLRAQPGIRIVGPSESGPSRVPTISFIHESVPSAAISQAAAAENIGLRYGHCYSSRLLERMGIDPRNGVARASLAHYNTAAEVDRLIDVLGKALGVRPGSSVPGNT